MFDTTTLATLRRDLVTARAVLRVWEDGFPTCKAEAEERVIRLYDDPKQLGANEADRKRAMLLSLESDTDYNSARASLEAAQRDVDRLTTEIAILEDQRRTQEWEIRGRLADAMLAAEATPIMLTNTERVSLAHVDQ